ncbi:Hypothetical protein DEACI_0944 [Acididesulfobacillus acetoxydans]|uniref:Uncharacterized protein n=1 Tax=Acididesulfobacillus acetoxydans TaxID=1561005 RepID=A0A8S0WEN0_9FIRM|nr:hypothetical protein [Acididesulfobacillus acetoxydans]CAA7600292.1 Hypothetical protein DEACI_0944 [Acididesulfobacillus acetoxydans]CEJ06068.1 Hypothetical protein DEACI_0514 [Acididesulfobacillus acetoxydans]
MLELGRLERQCPVCKGQGRMENPNWAQFWRVQENMKNSFRTRNADEPLDIAAEMLPPEPSEPMFFLCQECHGRGKLLTPEGEILIRFVRFWLNPNY